MQTVTAAPQATDAVARPASRGRSFVMVFALVGCGLLLGSVSSPGGSFLMFMSSIAMLFIAGVGWLASVVDVAMHLLRKRPTPSSRWLIVPVLLVAATLGLCAVDAPWKARWRFARPAFEQVADRAEPGLRRTERNPIDIDRNQRIGSFEVRSVVQQGDAVIFTTSGGFIDDVGLAYLPSGPFPELENGGFERPRFQPLGDGWYSWTASW